MPNILQRLQDAYNGSLDCAGCDLERFAPTPNCLSCGKYGQFIRTREEEMMTLLPELMDAVHNGTVIGLPCAIGTPVYNITWWDTEIESVEVKGKLYSRQIRKSKVSKSKFSWFDISQFGKTVFLTKSEAQAALESKVQHAEDS